MMLKSKQQNATNLVSFLMVVIFLSGSQLMPCCTHILHTISRSTVFTEIFLTEQAVTIAEQTTHITLFNCFISTTFTLYFLASMTRYNWNNYD